MPSFTSIRSALRSLSRFSVPPNLHRSLSTMPLVYPSTRRDESVVETLHGHQIADPYRWLEDPDSPETAAWVNRQNELTQSYLSSAAHLRDSFQKKVEQLIDYDKFSAAWKRGSYFYYYHHQGLANQAVLMQTRSLDAEPRVFLDPNTMSEDGTVSLGVISWSRNGKYVAYGVQRGGSDWVDIQIMDCDTLEKATETVEWAKFTSIAWTHDAKGFYYARYPAPASLEGAERDKRGAETDATSNQQVYYHVVGTNQKEDRLVLEDPDHPKRMYGLRVTDDGEYLIVTVTEDCAPKNQLWYVNLTTSFEGEAEAIVKVVDESFDAQFNYIANDGRLFYLMTNWKAPRNRIVALDLDQSTEWQEIVSEDKQKVLSAAQAVNFDQMVLTYMKDANDKLSIHSLSTGEKKYDIELPDLGSVSVSAKREDDFLMYKFSSFLYPGTVYYVDLTMPLDDGTRVFRSMNPPGFDPTKYRTTQEFYSSKDGTRVPMFVIRPREDTDTPQKRPALLYGYGGFMISLTPYFSARFASWLECLGGIVAIANIRGGDEYGEEWHNQGILEKKQNVFDDFQWGAKHLCKMGVTQENKLLIMGGSNGGLLVGACVNQAPELYGAAVAQVGVHDILRFHKFTIGSAWVSDFGNPDKAEDFAYQIKYSPLHNVFSPDERGVPYPSILLTTADHDDRVVPLHTLKYGAQLQYRAGSSTLQEGRPLLIRIDVKAGHGQGKPTGKVIEEIVDTLLFAALALKADVPRH